MDDKFKKLLEKQQYRIVGEHGAVKLCSWLKKSVKGEGVCYKEKFYGIKSHRCCQMTPDVNFCQNSCIFCWRNLEGSQHVMDEKKIAVDDPELLIDESIRLQRKLLNGYPGNTKTQKDIWNDAQEPMHFAISLAGEPTLYPRLAELITKLHERSKTTFLVTNGLLPMQLLLLEKKHALPTQLYVSLDAPNRELFYKVDRCTLKDGWERLNESLQVLKSLKDKTRTAVRVTLIKDMNMVHPEEYARLLEKADALFVEIKAYMHVGSSCERLTIEHMPFHEDIVAFSQEIARHCGYRIIDEQRSSRVVLLMREDFPGRIMKFPEV